MFFEGFEERYQENISVIYTQETHGDMSEFVELISEPDFSIISRIKTIKSDKNIVYSPNEVRRRLKFPSKVRPRFSPPFLTDLLTVNIVRTFN